MNPLVGQNQTTGVPEHELRPRVQLGQLLLHKGLINELQLLQGLHYHKTHGMRLGEALLDLKFITERTLKMVLAEQLDIKLMPIDYIDFIPPNLTGYINKEYAWRHKVCPVRRANDHLTIVMDDPTDTAAIDFIHCSTHLHITVCTAPRAVIVQLLTRVYGPRDGSRRTNTPINR